MMKRLLVAVICGFPLAFGGQLRAGEPREFVDPGVALEERVQHGDDAVVQARQALANGDANDPLLRSRLAQAYFAMNRDEDALPELLWCMDDLEKRDAPQYTMEKFRVLASLIRLAQRYEPAMAALVERRSAAEIRLRNGSPEPSDALFVTGVNLGLDDDAATLALYQDVKGGKLGRLDLSTLRWHVLRILLKNKEYGEIAAEFDVAARVAEAFDRYDQFMGHSVDWGAVENRMDEWTREQWAKMKVKSGESIDVSLRKGVAMELRGDIARWYEILIGTGQSDRAREIATRLIAALDDGKTRNALARAGYRTGSPVEEHLVYAQEAFEMTGGEDLHVVDTLARLLAGFKRRDEAIDIAEAGVQRAETAAERELMNACLEYCRRVPASDSG
ncbi:MAG: hypothetical protein OXG44_10275 [Gammaproteobacteria bacterium]|nr:hypothetical protein [Gammaproteobacteria bacterium]